MFRMFSYAETFNCPIENWDVSSDTRMGFIFESANNFSQSINVWDVSGVRKMYGMFYRAQAFNQCLSTWSGKVPYVETSNMFYQSGCPITDDPVPNGEPWCQGPEECQLPCENSVAALSTNTINDLCNLPSGISKNCPELCPGNERCPCTDYLLPFQGTSCALVSGLKKKKREKRCDTSQNIASNSPGTCMC